MEDDYMETSNEKKFSLMLNKAEKILNAETHGLFKPEDAAAFVADYTHIVGQINPAEYTLHFDSAQLKVSTQDMIPLLSACFKMYKKDGYKKIIFDCGTSATLKMQIRRVGTMVGLENYEIVA
jgi:hypothetical protein